MPMPMTSGREDAVAGLAGVIVAGDTYRLAAAEFFGLGLADTHAISYLDTHGPMPQARLARYMGVTTGGATGIVDRLEKADIAVRRPDPFDRRKHRVELTDRAQAIIEKSLERLDHAFDGFDEEAVRTLSVLLPRLAVGLDEQAQYLRTSPAADAGGTPPPSHEV